MEWDPPLRSWQGSRASFWKLAGTGSPKSIGANTLSGVRNAQGKVLRWCVAVADRQVTTRKTIPCSSAARGGATSHVWRLPEHTASRNRSLHFAEVLWTAENGKSPRLQSLSGELESESPTGILALPKTKAGLRRGGDGNRHLRSDAAVLFARNLKAPSSAEPLLQKPGHKFRLLWKWTSSVLKLENLHFFSLLVATGWCGAKVDRHSRHHT